MIFIESFVAVVSSMIDESRIFNLESIYNQYELCWFVSVDCVYQFISLSFNCPVVHPVPFQIFVDRLAKRDPNLGERLRAWPRTINLGDLFSGAGTFQKVCDAAFGALQKKFPLDLAELKAYGNWTEGSKFKLKFHQNIMIMESCWRTESRIITCLFRIRLD